MSEGSNNTMPETASPWHRMAAHTAVVAAVFCLIVIGLLTANYLRGKAMDPLQPVKIQQLQVELAKNPADEALKERIRQLDYDIRREYFRSQAFAVQGAYLLTGGIALFLLAWELARRLRRKLPVPRANAGQVDWAAVAMGRRGVSALGLLMAGLLLTVAVLSRHDNSAEYVKCVGMLPPDAATASAPAATTTTVPAATAPPATNTAPPALPQPTGALVLPERNPSLPPAAISIVALPPFPEAWMQNWPQFRGPHANGIAVVTDAPTSWNGKTGEHIRWKTAVPLPGHNSPIVWGDAVFLSGADEQQREVYCFDAGNGKLRWKAAVSTPEGVKSEPSVMEDTGYAAPTMVTDGEQVYAIFANGDVAAFDFAGKQVWARHLGTPESMYGYAASLAIAPTRLFIQLDQGTDGEEEKSALMALNTATGVTVWQTKRAVPNSWSSPIVIHTEKGPQIITSANPWVIAYDPGSGAELWRADCLSGDVGPTPIFVNGMVYATTAYANLAAIRPDGRGDVTKTHIVWMANEGLPDTVSPLCNGEIVLVSDGGGALTCYDAANGKKLWEHAYEDSFHASPVLVGKRIYHIDARGVMHLLEAGRTFKQIGTAALGEDVHASPAVVGDRIYIRGTQHLYCIGAK